MREICFVILACAAACTNPSPEAIPDDSASTSDGSMLQPYEPVPPGVPVDEEDVCDCCGTDVYVPGGNCWGGACDPWCLTPDAGSGA